MSEFLQLLNVALTSGVMLMLIGAAVAYGRLTQKVESHGDSIHELWDRHNKLSDHVMERK